MKIIKDFPVFQIGDKVKVNPEEQGGATEAEVVKTWYPQEGDVWNELDEVKYMGYLNSKSDLPFPQLMVKITAPVENIKEGRFGFLHINTTEFITKI